MKTDDATTSTTPTSHDKRTGRRVGAVVAVALFGLAACTSDPGARRVAEDIIRAEAEANSDLDEQCMLDALEGIPDSELDQITSSNEDTRAQAQAAFEAALGACN